MDFHNNQEAEEHVKALELLKNWTFELESKVRGIILNDPT
jgi:hypothetical protein